MAFSDYEREYRAIRKRWKFETILQEVPRNTHTELLRVRRNKRILRKFPIKPASVQARNKNRCRGTESNYSDSQPISVKIGTKKSVKMHRLPGEGGPSVPNQASGELPRKKLQSSNPARRGGDGYHSHMDYEEIRGRPFRHTASPKLQG